MQPLIWQNELNFDLSTFRLVCLWFFQLVLAFLESIFWASLKAFNEFPLYTIRPTFSISSSHFSVAQINVIWLWSRLSSAIRDVR